MEGEVVEWVVELKIDGVVVFVIYEDGVLVWGVICGDGWIGDDIIYNVCMLLNLLFCLIVDWLLKCFEVCGEIYMVN